ncbi:MAG: hypothetical protein JSS35_16660, partial [Proteobacteria bacterium]|nr:hypothetical protein [Pseudomonadota bacterium]
NPFRSVLGYIAVSSDEPAVWGPVLVTREDLGDEPPILLSADSSGPVDAVARLHAANESHGLVTGDVVVLGAARLSGEGWDELCAHRVS